MHNEIECPYCGHEFDFTGDLLDDGESIEEQCPDCEKNFMLTAHLNVTYSTAEADCLNGGAHRWKQVTGVPQEYFAGLKRCQDCGEERREQAAQHGGRGDE